MYTPKDQGIYINYELITYGENNLFNLIDKSKDIIVKYKDGKTEDKHKNDEICFNNTKIKNADCCIYLTLSNIKYLPNEELDKHYISLKTGNINRTIIARLAKLKSQYWDFEYETRIIASFASYKKSLYESPEGIYVPLNLKNMKVTVYVNPWATEKFKEDVENIY